MATFVSLANARFAAGDRISDQSTQDQTVSGRNLISGVGVVVFDLRFPVTFAGRPIFTSGAELDPQTPFSGDLDTLTPPWATAMVIDWDFFGDIVGAFEGYFKAATLLAVVNGVKNQMTWITWSFHGPALRNPVGSEDVINLNG